jgi:hypothetical protein
MPRDVSQIMGESLITGSPISSAHEKNRKGAFEGASVNTFLLD